MNFLTTMNTAATVANTEAAELKTLTKEDLKTLQAITGSKTASVTALTKAGGVEAFKAIDATFKAFTLEAASKQAQLEIVLHARAAGWNPDAFTTAFKAALIAAGMADKSAANRASEAKKVMSYADELPQGTASLQNMAKAINALVKPAGNDTGKGKRAPRTGVESAPKATGKQAGIVTTGDALADHLAALRTQVEWLQAYVKPSEVEALDLISTLVDVVADLEDALVAPELDDVNEA